MKLTYRSFGHRDIVNKFGKSIKLIHSVFNNDVIFFLKTPIDEPLNNVLHSESFSEMALVWQPCWEFG